MKKDVLIYETASIKDALKQLNKTAERVLFVVEKSARLLGTVTDGDIRRHLLNGKKMDDDIKDVYNKNPRYLRKDIFSQETARKVFIEHQVDLLPIINDEESVIDYIAWSDVFSDGAKLRQPNGKLDIPLVIMAGGKGTRLEPFSKIFPKPLIPVGDRPVIQIIVDEFRAHGVREFYLTLNHKAKMIEAYFNNIDKDYEIKYVTENNFFGTAGSLRLLEKEIGQTFIVSNCDVIVRANFEEVLKLHKKTGASMTVLSSVWHHRIPYGIVNFKEQGEIVDIVEKPEYTFTINTGVYILDKAALEFIPRNASFSMTDLISRLIVNKHRVITYPVNENDYIDIGQWDEYKAAVEKIKLL